MGLELVDDNDRPGLSVGPSAWHQRKRGTQNQAIGKSRGGLTTKIAVIVDALGNLIRFVPLPGQRHDISSFDALIVAYPVDSGSSICSRRGT